MGTPATFEAALQLIAQHVHECCQYVKAAVSGGGRLVDPTTGLPVEPRYPTTLIGYDCGSTYAFELMGASKRYHPLDTLRSRRATLNSFLGQFRDATATAANDACFTIAETGNLLANLTLLTEQSQDLLKTRYAYFESMNSTVLVRRGTPAAGGSSLQIETGEVEDLALINVLTAATLGRTVRARFFQTALVFSSQAPSSFIAQKLHEFLPVGNTEILARYAADSRLNTAANVASLSAMESTQETTITGFIERNPEVLLRALEMTELHPQLDLPWLVPAPSGVDEESIRPDFLLVGRDGKAHICDFKLPLHSHTDLTAGPGSRRRLRTSVADGIEQLANYAEFLDLPEHRTYLESKYRISMAETPRLILVVGSDENYDVEKVRQAMRSRASQFEIVDFDTLRMLYLRP